MRRVFAIVVGLLLSLSAAKAEFIQIFGPGISNAFSTTCPSASNGQLLFDSNGTCAGITGWTTNGTTTLIGAAASTLAISGANISTFSLANAGTTNLAGATTISPSLAVNGCTIGTDAICATGTGNISGSLTVGGAVKAATGQSFQINGGTGAYIDTNEWSLISSAYLGWAPGSTAITTNDFRFSRSGVGVGSVDTTTTGNSLGSLKMAVITSANAWHTGLASDTGHLDNTVCVDSTGNLVKGSGAAGICAGTSSARFKTQIADLRGDAVSKVMALRPVSYFYKKGYGDDGATQKLGFTAEDMDRAIPEIVGRDQSGKPNTIDMNGMIPVIVKAIQQQQAEIDSLKARLH